jgi:cytochrome c-type biogenesis protein
MNKRFISLVVFGLALVGLVVFFRLNSGSTAALWGFSDGGNWLLPLVLVAALIDSFNPCAFSVLLLTIAFLFSIGKLRSNIIRIGSFYIAGVFAVYILIGLGILQTLHLFNTPHFMAKVGATLLIILGLINLINEFFPRFPIKLKIPAISHRWLASLMEKGSLPTAFALGILVGLCEFPCTGGPYLLVLGLLHDQSTFWSGLGYLVLYNLMFILPLVIILLVAGDQQLLTKVSMWKKSNIRAMKLYGALAMIALGLIIFLF